MVIKIFGLLCLTAGLGHSFIWALALREEDYSKATHSLILAICGITSGMYFWK